jgi:hypothetical protein
LGEKENTIEPVVSTVSDFLAAVKRAQSSPEKNKFVEVSKEVFDHYMHGSETEYFTTGAPGVRVYVKGTREAIEAKEKRTTEWAHDPKSASSVI